jgi:site-specific recombinase XerC
VAGFLADQADQGIRPSTMGRRVAAIRYAHRLAGRGVPTEDERVRSVVRGHRRAAGTAPARKAPATAERIIAMALVPGDDLKAIRDRALLLLGFAGAFRRSELVALDVEELDETDAGLRVTTRRSKTDQEGQGATIAIVKGLVACPVAALKNWLEAAKIGCPPSCRPASRASQRRKSRLLWPSLPEIRPVAGRVGPAGERKPNWPHGSRS